MMRTTALPNRSIRVLFWGATAFVALFVAFSVYAGHAGHGRRRSDRGSDHHDG